MSFFNEAAREAAARAIRRRENESRPTRLIPDYTRERRESADAVLNAALEALPPRSKAILALAELTDAAIKRAVFDGASNFCSHGGEPVDGDYCCPDCEQITDEVLRRLAALGLPVAEQEDAE